LGVVFGELQARIELRWRRRRIERMTRGARGPGMGRQSLEMAIGSRIAWSLTDLVGRVRSIVGWTGVSCTAFALVEVSVRQAIAVLSKFGSQPGILMTPDLSLLMGVGSGFEASE
jgi:hypothetical protein